MREEGRNCYSSGGRNRGRNGNRSGRGGSGMVEFNGHSSDGGDFSERKMLGRRSKGGVFYSH